MSIQTTQPKAPVIDPGAITEMTDGVWVIPDSDRTPMVPNIGNRRRSAGHARDRHRLRPG